MPVRQQQVRMTAWTTCKDNELSLFAEHSKRRNLYYPHQPCAQRPKDIFAGVPKQLGVDFLESHAFILPLKTGLFCNISDPLSGLRVWLLSMRLSYIDTCKICMPSHVCSFREVHHSPDGGFHKQTYTFVQYIFPNGNVNWISHDNITFCCWVKSTSHSVERKWPPFCKRHFHMNFPEWFYYYYYYYHFYYYYHYYHHHHYFCSYFSKMCFQGPINDDKIAFFSDIGLAPNM